MPHAVAIPSIAPGDLSIGRTPMPPDSPSNPTATSRLAPSPTGALHLGNARTFLVNWALARTRGWRIVLRMEDLDGPRIKPGAETETSELLAWMGLDWAGPPLTQSDDLSPYREAMQHLCGTGQVFPCALSRGEIRSASSAPQEGATDSAYPTSLRPGNAGSSIAFLEEDHNYRFLVPDTTVVINDQFAGNHAFDLAGTTGDFVTWTRRATPAYQLSVVVDDIRQDVTDVVRGDDLLESAARQTLIYNALGHPPPRWWHLPLVLGPDGHRLAKRHGDTRLSAFRRLGMTAPRLIGLLATWCGCSPPLQEMTMAEFLDAFDLDHIPRDPITFTEQEYAWLVSSS